LQISPAASLEEISAAYHSLKNTWREDRFLQVDAWQEKSKVKLAEIEKAYDRILKSLLQQATDPRREPDPGGDDPSLPLPEEEIPFQREDPSLALPEDEDPLAADEEPAFIDRVRAKSRLSRRSIRLAALVLMLVMVAGALLVWPTLYRYDVIQSGDKVIHLRVNRLTSTTTDIDGNPWVTPPPGEPEAGPSLTRQPAPPPPAVRALPAETASPGPVVAAIPAPSGQKSETRRDLPAKKTPEAALSGGALAPAPPETPKALKTKPRPAAKDKPLPGGGYSIQVKAFQEEAKARDFLNGIRSSHPDARVQKAVIKGKGVWYRVLIGHYPSRKQALADLKKKGLAESYPGSFIQRTGKGA
jgi:cell division septation protein DedD